MEQAGASSPPPTGKENAMNALMRIALCIFAAACSSAASAQTYPERPIRMIVSIAADTDFVPITRLFFLVEGVFVSVDSNIGSVAELKKAAQADSAKLNFGTLGEGSSPDLFLRWMNNQWHSQIVGVPYKGGGPAAQALAANEIQVTRFGVGNFKGLVDAGKVKALTVNSAERSRLLPNVPTDKEAGFGEFPARGWWGLAAPKGTPPQITAKLNTEFVKLFNEPSFVAFLEKNFVVAAPTTPEN